MKRMSIAGLSLLAALAIGAAATASASAALPEFSGPFPKAFSGKGGTVAIETVGKVKATCTGSTTTGEVTGAKQGKTTLTLTGCGAAGLTCASKGAKEGEIVSNVLNVTLGYINKALKEVGVDLKPAKGPITTFTCGPATIVVTGSVIGRITPVNKKVNAGKPFTLTFKQAKGKQKPNKLEGGPIDVPMGSIQGGTPEEAGIATKAKLTLTEAAEIKA